MRWDLEKAYIPSCPDCQRNQSQTTKPPGPLHPLPISDECRQSIMMDCLGADMRIIPTQTNISAEDLGVLFLTTGIAKMVYLWILSLIETNYSCWDFGRLWQHSGVKLKCPWCITLKPMNPLNILTGQSTNSSIFMSIGNKKVGFVPCPGFSLWLWTLWMPPPGFQVSITSQLVSSCYFPYNSHHLDCWPVFHGPSSWRTHGSN